jgi:Tfp pilus assembly protein PilW
MTLIELLTTMTILAFVLSGIVVMFVSGLHSEVDMNQRFQAQQSARLALSSLRSEVQSACSVSVASGGASVTLVLPNSDPSQACSTGTTQDTWCAASSSGAAPFGLYRQSGGSCAASTGVKRADSLTTSAVFAAASCAAGTTTHPQLAVTFPVDANLATSTGSYTLSDTLTARNAPVVTC